MLFALGFFDVCRFCDDGEEVSLKMPSRPTAAIEAGARGLAKRISRMRSCMFFAHRLHPQLSSAWRAVCLTAVPAAAGTGVCMICMVQTVLTIHVQQAQVYLPRLPLSATKASLAKLLLHCHPSRLTQNISNVPELQKKTRRRLHGLNPGQSQ